MNADVVARLGDMGLAQLAPKKSLQRVGYRRSEISARDIFFEKA